MPQTFFTSRSNPYEAIAGGVQQLGNIASSAVQQYQASKASADHVTNMKAQFKQALQGAGKQLAGLTDQEVQQYQSRIDSIQDPKELDRQVYDITKQLDERAKTYKASQEQAQQGKEYVGALTDYKTGQMGAESGQRIVDSANANQPAVAGRASFGLPSTGIVQQQPTAPNQLSMPAVGENVPPLALAAGRTPQVSDLQKELTTPVPQDLTSTQAQEYATQTNVPSSVSTPIVSAMQKEETESGRAMRAAEANRLKEKLALAKNDIDKAKMALDSKHKSALEGIRRGQISKSEKTNYDNLVKDYTAMIGKYNDQIVDAKTNAEIFGMTPDISGYERSISEATTKRSELENALMNMNTPSGNAQKVREKTGNVIGQTPTVTTLKDSSGRTVTVTKRQNK